ncbi:hypothetical protein D0860_05469 [Hortaea werneckii]|uniref:Moybdenum cofactor oxidoreductase dimerisation domain-containing protein n=1 Tax=Hortaea werneckii TaxID=91943 RepID=A0A3M7GZP7_HORWE|nr:hypothetical protein D0860_05469 [Hortaea werneckii]
MNSGLVDHYEFAKGDCKPFGQMSACHSIQTCRNVEFLRRYAFFGGGRHIMRIDVSPNIEKTWQQTHMESIQEQKDHRNVCIKAANNECNTQLRILDAYYNFRGNLASGGHRMPVREALHAAVVHKK